MNICLFEKEEIGRPLSLRDERAVHILKILHKKVGDSFRAGILDGEEGEAKITKIEKFTRKSADCKKSFDDGALYFSFEAKNLGKRLYPLKMIIGFPRPIQLKRLLRDMAGLGVCEIHLCGTDLGEKSYLDSDLADENELHKLLLEGTVQAGGTFVPKVFLYKSLDECLSSICDFGLCEGSGNFAAKSGNFAERTGGFVARSGETKFFALDNVNPACSLVEELNLFANGGVSARSGGFVARSGDLQARSGNLSAESGSLVARSGNLQAKSGSLVARSENFAATTDGLAERTGDFSATSENLSAETGSFAKSSESTATSNVVFLKTAYAAIGSERGWSERERKVLETYHFVRCSMGSRILRTETAATVAATLILAKMNFL